MERVLYGSVFFLGSSWVLGSVSVLVLPWTLGRGRNRGGDTVVLPLVTRSSPEGPSREPCLVCV